MARRPKNFSPQDLAEIEILAGMGLTQEQIADVKGVCIDTLRKYALKEYKRGKSKGIARVSKTAFEMATSGKCAQMTMFYLKTQAQWREQPPVPEILLEILKAKGLINEDGH